MKKMLFISVLLMWNVWQATARATASPAAVGWGNILVPGLGATFREQPLRGALEAGIEIGLFYGGTFGVREGNFTIDSTVLLPQRGSLFRPLLGQAMQQFGLKLHMFNTFYHYQQASLELQKSDVESRYQQPLYKGSWTDVLSAPFRWKNLSSPYVYCVIAAAAALLAIDYHTTSVSSSTYQPTGVENALFGVNSIGVVPLGSAFGEEPLFRGMMQREFHLYTNSLVVSILMQSALFTSLHPGAALCSSAFGRALLRISGPSLRRGSWPVDCCPFLGGRNQRFFRLSDVSRSAR